MNTTLTILHPGIEDATKAKPRLAARVDSLRGRRLALLDNGKVNAGAILAALASRLQQQGVAEVRAWKKPHAAESGEKRIAELMAWKPDLVLTGIGD